MRKASSEYNPSEMDIVHLLQIWILPQKKGVVPSYEQRSFSEEQKHNRFCLIASGVRDHEAVKIHQDANLYAAQLSAGEKNVFEISGGRFVWVQVICGEILLNALLLKGGDGARIMEEEILTFTTKQNSEILLFDLA